MNKAILGQRPNGSPIMGDDEMEKLIKSTMYGVLEQFRIATAEGLTIPELDFLAGNVLARVVHSAPADVQRVFDAVLALLDEDLEGQQKN